MTSVTSLPNLDNLRKIGIRVPKKHESSDAASGIKVSVTSAKGKSHIIKTGSSGKFYVLGYVADGKNAHKNMKLRVRYVPGSGQVIVGVIRRVDFYLAEDRKVKKERKTAPRPQPQV